MKHQICKSNSGCLSLSCEQMQCKIDVKILDKYQYQILFIPLTFNSKLDFSTLEVSFESLLRKKSSKFISPQ